MTDNNADFEVIFVVEEHDVKTSRNLLVEYCGYFQEILQQAEPSTQVRIRPPSWIVMRPFKLFLSCLEAMKQPKLPQMDILSAQKVIWLCDLFKAAPLLDRIIREVILPQQTRETVLIFIQDAIVKIMGGDTLPCWQELYEGAVRFAVDNIIFILQRFSHVVISMEHRAVIDMIYRSLKLPVFRELGEVEQILQVLIGIGTVKNPLEMYINHFNQNKRNFSANDVYPKCQAKLQDLEPSNFYKEIQEFEDGNVQWKLAVSYFAHEQKLEFHLRQTYDSAPQPSTVNPKYSMICLWTSLYILGIDDHPPQSPQNVIIITGKQSQVNIRVIENFVIDSGTTYNLQLYFQSDYLQANLLTYLLAHVNEYLLQGDSSLIDINSLKTLLKHKHLNVSNEYEALTILLTWLNYNSATNEEVQQLLDCIRWTFVTEEQILAVYNEFPQFRASPAFQDRFIKEMKSKAWVKRTLSRKNNLEADEGTKARRSYKQSALEMPQASPQDIIEHLATMLLEQGVKQAVGEELEKLRNEKMELIKEREELRAKLKRLEIQTAENQNAGMKNAQEIIEKQQNEIRQLQEAIIQLGAEEQVSSPTSKASHESFSVTPNIPKSKRSQSNSRTYSRGETRTGSLDFKGMGMERYLNTRPEGRKVHQLLATLRTKMTSRISSNNSSSSSFKPPISETLLGMSNMKRSSKQLQ